MRAGGAASGPPTTPSGVEPARTSGQAYNDWDDYYRSPGYPPGFFGSHPSSSSGKSHVNNHSIPMIDN